MPRKSKKAGLTGGSAAFDAQRIPLAKMKVSIRSKSISKLEVPKVVADASPSKFSLDSLSREDCASSNSQALQTKDEKMKKQNDISSKKKTKEEMQAIDAIWKHLGDGSIDLRYATVGYGFNGRPIIDHDIFVNLLINYGFSISIILDFIDDFNKVSLEDDSFPMVMVNSYMQTIYQEVDGIIGDDEHKS